MRLYGKEAPDREIEQFVREYAAAIEANPRHRHHVQTMLLPGEPGRALDYGCGWGINSRVLWERGFDVLGIDYSQNEVDICRLVWGEQDRLSFRSISIEELETGAFDCVLSSQVAEHVHNLGNYLCGINRVLRDNGSLVISVPGGVTLRSTRALLRRNLEAALRDHSRVMMQRYDKTHDHIHSWDQFHFVRLLASAGFELERYEPAEGVPAPWGRRNWALRRGRLRHLAYTMVFRFRKVADVSLPENA